MITKLTVKSFPYLSCVYERFWRCKIWQ